jgi:hypothetical protein
VGHDLMAEEIEIDPGVGRAALRTAQDLPVEAAGGRQIVHGKGDVEWGQVGHGAFLRRRAAR